MHEAEGNNKIMNNENKIDSAINEVLESKRLKQGVSFLVLVLKKVVPVVIAFVVIVAIMETLK
mgnify:CR=1 FL=1